MAEETTLVEVMIEIQVGSRAKYEYDARRGILRLDRVLYAAMHYPTAYGFVPETVAGDGDPLDVLVLGDEPVVAGCYLAARVIGLLGMRDGGQPDDKLVAVMQADPRLDTLHSLADVAPHRLREIETFFQTYKDLEGEQTEIEGWRGIEDAVRLLDACRQAFRAGGSARPPGAQRPDAREVDG